jgi:hypothetical protein
MPPAPNNLNFDCDWRYGFNVDARRKGTVGYLLSWSGCGGLTLATDIEVWNPFSSPGQTVVSGAKVVCVGLIEHFKFEGGADDPIRISAFVSKGAAANVRAKLATPLTSTKLKVGFYVMGFDDERKAWYEAALIKDGSGKVSAVVDTVDGVLQLFVANETTPLAEHLDIQLQRIEFQLAPAEGKTATLEFATGPSTRVVRAWGDAGD